MRESVLIDFRWTWAPRIGEYPVSPGTASMRKRLRAGHVPRAHSGRDASPYEILIFFGRFFSVFGSATDRTPLSNVALIWSSFTDSGRRMAR